jgi:hypothetical protein
MTTSRMTSFRASEPKTSIKFRTTAAGPDFMSGLWASLACCFFPQYTSKLSKCIIRQTQISE